ncbi:unnamed protein product, partial [Prorocentrum cordatum]
PRAHPAFRVAFASDREAGLAAAQRPTGAAAPAGDSDAGGGVTAEGGGLVLEVVGLSAQDAAALYALQCRAAPDPASAAEAPASAAAAREAAKRKPGAKADAAKSRSQGAAPRGGRASAEAAAAASAEGEGDGWQSAEVWPVQDGDERSFLAGWLPRCPVGTRVICRLAHRHLTDCAKWAALVRRDTAGWLGQACVAVAVGLPAPSAVQCRGEVPKAEGAGLRLRVDWSVPEACSKLLAGSTLLWQYRTRQLLEDGSAKAWETSPVLEWPQAEEGTGGSSPLPGDWLARDGQRVWATCCVRYADGSFGEWSPWSPESRRASLNLLPPRPPGGPAAGLRADMALGEPTRARLEWQPFSGADPNIGLLEYRALLREAGENEASPCAAAREAWSEVGWLQAESSTCDPLSCDLSSLHPGRRYAAQVEARHCGGGESWSEPLACFFRPPTSYAGCARMPPPTTLTAAAGTEGVGDAGSEAERALLVQAPGGLAGSAGADLRLEWRRCGPGDEGTWAPLEREPAHPEARAGPEEDSAAVVAARLPEAGHGGAVARCRAGAAVSSMAWLPPRFPPPAAPRAVLVATDHRLEVQVACALPGRPGDRLGGRAQLRAERCGEGGGGCVEAVALPPVALDLSDPQRPDFKSVLSQGTLKLQGTYAFRARVRDGGAFSPWSEASRPVCLVAAAPRARSGAALVVRAALARATGAELTWDAFLLHEGLHAVDYCVSAAPAERPEDRVDEQTVQSASGGQCHACFGHLVPDSIPSMCSL